MDDKNLVLTSGPEEQDGRPHPPLYRTLYSDKRLEALAHEITVSDDYEDVLDILLLMRHDYDQITAEAQFHNWQLEGMLKGLTR